MKHHEFLLWFNPHTDEQRAKIMQVGCFIFLDYTRDNGRLPNWHIVEDWGKKEHVGQFFNLNSARGLVAKWVKWSEKVLASESDYKGFVEHVKARKAEQIAQEAT